MMPEDEAVELSHHRFGRLNPTAETAFVCGEIVEIEHQLTNSPPTAQS